MKPHQFYNEHPEAIGYTMDSDVFDRLKRAHYLMFKGGAKWDPDKWRDMENLFASALNDIEPIMDKRKSL